MTSDLRLDCRPRAGFDELGQVADIVGDDGGLVGEGLGGEDDVGVQFPRVTDRATAATRTSPVEGGEAHVVRGEREVNSGRGEGVEVSQRLSAGFQNEITTDFEVGDFGNEENRAGPALRDKPTLKFRIAVGFGCVSCPSGPESSARRRDMLIRRVRRPCGSTCGRNFRFPRGSQDGGGLPLGLLPSGRGWL